MGRPRLEEARRRRQKIGASVTDAEARLIKAAARRRRMSPGVFVRTVALAAAEAGDKPAVDFAVLRAEVRRIGANLNQALKLAHQGKDAELLSAVRGAAVVVSKVVAP